MMRLAVGAIPPPALAYKQAVVSGLAPERGPRLAVIYVRVLVSFLEIFFGLISVCVECLVGVNLGVIAQPRESKEVAHVKLDPHAVLASFSRFLWHSLQMAA